MTRCNDGLGKDGSKVPSECGKASSISNWLSHCVSKMQIEWTANAYTSTDVSGKHLVCLNACKCSALKSKAWSIDPILYAAPPCFLMCEHSHRGEKHKSVSKYANGIDCQHRCAQHGQQRDLPCIEVGTCKLDVSFICRLTSLGFYWRGLFNIILVDSHLRATNPERCNRPLSHPGCSRLPFNLETECSIRVPSHHG